MSEQSENLSISYRATLLVEGITSVDSLTKEELAALDNAVRVIEAKHKEVSTAEHLEMLEDMQEDMDNPKDYSIESRLEEVKEKAVEAVESYQDVKEDLNESMKEAELLSTFTDSEDIFISLVESMDEDIEDLAAIEVDSLAVSLTKEDKNPEGGLSEKGRQKFNSKTGSNLKPGVKGAADTPEKMRRKGSFLTRFFKNPSGPLVDKKGRPTRLALSAKAWGEPIPKNAEDARSLYRKGVRLLERYKKTQESEKASTYSELQKASISTNDNVTDLSEADIFYLSNGMIRIPIAKKGKFYHPHYTNSNGEPVLEFTDKDFSDIINNFQNNRMGFAPYATYGHPKQAWYETVDAQPKHGELLSLKVDEDILYGDFEVNQETYESVVKGEYEYNSGEFLRNVPDKTTGENIGTVLVRTALTNSPFIPFDDVKVQALSTSTCPQSHVNFMLHLQSSEGVSTNKEKEPMTEQTQQASSTEVEHVEDKEQLALSDLQEQLLSLKTMLTESMNSTKELKEENAALSEELKATKQLTQNLSNGQAAYQDSVYLQSMANAGVSPVFLNRFSNLKNALTQSQASNQIIKLSVGDQEVERNLVDEVAHLLVEAVNSNPEVNAVQAQQLGATTKASDPSGLYSRISEMAREIRKTSAKQSI